MPVAKQSISLAPDAIILAGGKGTRMGSDLPKVLLEVAGKPMVYWVVKACKEAGVRKCIIVIGYQGDLVKQALSDEPCCEFVVQAKQLGTGHAAMMAEPLSDPTEPRALFVLAGDGPLIRSQTLNTLLKLHRDTQAAATLATAVIDDPTGYGRILRHGDGSFNAIIEQKDATPDQLAICEINPSYYCFRSDLLFEGLHQIRNNNQQGEYYLTDIPGLLKTQNKIVSAIDAVPINDVLSINNPQQLAQVDQILRRRIAQNQIQGTKL